MAKFLLTLDDMAFTSSKKATELELGPRMLIKLNTELKEAGLLTATLLGIVSVRSSPDGGKEDGEYKAFTSVVVRVEAPSEAAAEAIKVRAALLEKSIDRLNAMHKGRPLENEDNWEVLEACEDEEAPESKPVPAKKIKKAKP